MTDKSADLVAYAKEVAATVDLFAVLGVDATSTNDEIHRAWRRTGLKYHPDKAGDAYDPEKYEGLTRARDVLVDPAAREAYDRARAAALEGQRRRDEMSAGRRRLVEELEAAERAAAAAPAHHPPPEKLSPEEARQRRDAMRAWEDVKRQRLQAEERERAAALEREMRSRAEDAERDAREAAIEQKLRENAERKAAKARRKAEREVAPPSAPDVATSAGAGAGAVDQGLDAMAAVRRTVADAAETATLARDSDASTSDEKLSSAIGRTRNSARAADMILRTVNRLDQGLADPQGGSRQSPWPTVKARAAAYQTWRDATEAFSRAHAPNSRPGTAASRAEVLEAAEKTLQSAKKAEEWLQEAMGEKIGA